MRGFFFTASRRPKTPTPAASFFKSAPKGRHHHPQRQSRCRPLSEAIHNPPPAGGHNPRAKGPSTLTPQVCPMARAATVISSGAARRYGADGNRSDDTLSREISHRNAARTIRGGDFSTPLRSGRNDGRARADFFIICGEAATTTLGLKGRQT